MKSASAGCFSQVALLLYQIKQIHVIIFRCMWQNSKTFLCDPGEIFFVKRYIFISCNCFNKALKFTI